MSDVWPVERVAALKDMAAAGLSARQIGDALNTTKAAIISKARKSGVSLRARPGGNVNKDGTPRHSPRAPKVARSHVRPPKPGPQNRPAVILGTTFKEGPESEASRAAFRHDGLTAVQRVEAGAGVASPDAKPFTLSHGCKWPLAGNVVCCNPISRGVYCEGHAQVAYVGVMRRTVAYEVVTLSNRFDRLDFEVPQGTRSGKYVGERDKQRAPETAWDSARAA